MQNVQFISVFLAKNQRSEGAERSGMAASQLASTPSASDVMGYLLCRHEGFKITYLHATGAELSHARF